MSPLYIGKALRLRRRIKQQLNNLKLMRAVEDARTGYRELHVAEFIGKAGQKAARAIAIIESLISTALVEGFELINIRGTKTLVHTITSSGNRVPRYWLLEYIIKLRKA